MSIQKVYLWEVLPTLTDKIFEILGCHEISGLHAGRFYAELAHMQKETLEAERIADA